MIVSAALFELESKNRDNRQAADQQDNTAHCEGEKQIFRHAFARDSAPAVKV